MWFVDMPTYLFYKGGAPGSKVHKHTSGACPGDPFVGNRKKPYGFKIMHTNTFNGKTTTILFNKPNAQNRAFFDVSAHTES